jgi:hypothetical protein
MFVRWKRRRLAKGRYEGDEWVRDHVRYAVLVMSRRTARGPRLRHVAHLGSIRERYMETPTHRGAFWEAVDRNLAEVEMSAEERARVVAGLEAAVPRATEEEVRAFGAGYEL